MADARWPAHVTKLESTRGAYAYLVEGTGPGQAAVLVDTGLPGRAGRILAEIDRRHASRPADIVVTHGDVDHVGNLAELAVMTGARVWVPAADRAYVVDGAPRPGVKRLVGALVRTRAPQGADTLVDGTRVGTLTAVATPGHTPGHMAFCGDGFVLVGDALTIARGRIRPSRGLMAWDSALAARSAHGLLTGFRGWVLASHAEPVWYEDRRRT